MAIHVPNVGKEQMLKLILNKTAQENLNIRLYTNDFTPGNSTVFADFTEPGGGGYVTKNIAAGDWTITPGTPSVAVAVQQSWVFTGMVGNVYGYFLVGQTNTTLVYWAERFTDGPYNIQVANDEIRITPRIPLTGV